MRLLSLAWFERGNASRVARRLEGREPESVSLDRFVGGDHRGIHHMVTAPRSGHWLPRLGTSNGRLQRGYRDHRSVG